MGNLNIILYTKPNCGKCITYKNKMDLLNMEYTVIEDEKITMELAKKMETEFIPFAFINEKFFSSSDLLSFLWNKKKER